MSTWSNFSQNCSAVVYCSNSTGSVCCRFDVDFCATC